MAEVNQPANELAVINDKTIEVFKKGSGILMMHQERATKALQVCGSILQQWDQAYQIEDADEKAKALAAVDERSNKFLVNCGVAVTEMKESRKAITQLMDSIKDKFTAEENKMDTTKGGKPAEVQVYRNGYAKWMEGEKKRIALEAQKKLDKAKEEAELKAGANGSIGSWLQNVLSNKKISITNTFNNIILETYDEKSNGLKNMNCEFPKDKVEGMQITVPSFRYHKEDEVATIIDNAKKDYDFEGFYKTYTEQIEALKKDLVDKLASKKSELDEAERLRLQKIKDDAELEKKLKKEKDEKEKQRLRDEAEQKQKKLDEDKLRFEKEKEQREEDDRKRIENERMAGLQKVEERVETAKAADVSAALFTQTEEVTSIGAGPASKKSFAITVKNRAGWVEMFTCWFQKEGVKTDLADLEKKTFKQIKTYCEKLAKEGEMIESKYLVYEEVHTAIKQKDKKKDDEEE